MRMKTYNSTAVFKEYYKIGEAAKLLNLSASAIRHYLDEFNIYVKKDRHGNRCFKNDDIGKLLHIRYMLYNEGLTRKGVKKRLNIS